MDAEALDELGMVMDFSDVRDRVKGWIDENIDHRMVLARGDPAVRPLTDLGEPLYLLDENPTAENLARHIHDGLSREGLTLAEVRLWETPSSYATYRVG